jgi:hypothetical protein
MTTLADFMGGLKTYEASKPNKSGKSAYLKHSHSEGNGLYTPKRALSITGNEQSFSWRALQRSGSSPSIPPTRILARLNGAHESLQSVYSEDDHLYSWGVNRSQPMTDLPGSITRGRSFSKPSISQFDDVPETEQHEFKTSQNQKRSRSPMRKIFGEGGWLSNPSPKDESGAPKKPGLVEKFRNKIGEIVCLTDLR